MYISLGKSIVYQTQTISRQANLLGAHKRVRALVIGGRSVTHPPCFHSFTLAVSELLGLRAPDISLICILYTRGALGSLRSPTAVLNTTLDRCETSISSSRYHLLLELCCLLTVEAAIKGILKVIIGSLLHHLGVLQTLNEFKFLLLHHRNLSLHIQKQ